MEGDVNFELAIFVKYILANHQGKIQMPNDELLKFITKIIKVLSLMVVFPKDRKLLINC